VLSSSEAQQPTRPYRIGYLSNAGEFRREQDDIFKQTLRELGYIEGQNLSIEWRLSKGKLELLPQLAAELVRLNLDCIVAAGVAPTRAVKQATSTIPIVMANADDDPVRHGLVASLARPGEMSPVSLISVRRQPASGWNCSRKLSLG
jgi:putative ABC transport system substrate-binding protein